MNTTIDMRLFLLEWTLPYLIHVFYINRYFLLKVRLKLGIELTIQINTNAVNLLNAVDPIPSQREMYTLLWLDNQLTIPTEKS